MTLPAGKGALGKTHEYCLQTVNNSSLTPYEVRKGCWSDYRGNHQYSPPIHYTFLTFQLLNGVVQLSPCALILPDSPLTLRNGTEVLLHSSLQGCDGLALPGTLGYGFLLCYLEGRNRGIVGLMGVWMAGVKGSP